MLGTGTQGIIVHTGTKNATTSSVYTMPKHPDAKESRDISLLQAQYIYCLGSGGTTTRTRAAS